MQMQIQCSPLKARILDHAETRLLEQGYRGMRVDELARDVGISKRTLYEQFRTKQEMAHEALSRRLERLIRGVEQLLVLPREESEQLREIVMLISQAYSKASPAFYRDLATSPSLKTLIEESRRSCFARVEGVIRSGIARGHFRANLDPRMVRRTLMAAVEGVLRPDVLAEDALTVDQAFEAILDVILNGVRICESR